MALPGDQVKGDGCLVLGILYSPHSAPSRCHRRHCDHRRSGYRNKVERTAPAISPYQCLLVQGLIFTDSLLINYPSLRRGAPAQVQHCWSHSGAELVLFVCSSPRLKLAILCRPAGRFISQASSCWSNSISSSCYQLLVWHGCRWTLETRWSTGHHILCGNRTAAPLLGGRGRGGKYGAQSCCRSKSRQWRQPLLRTPTCMPASAVSETARARIPSSRGQAP